MPVLTKQNPREQALAVKKVITTGLLKSLPKNRGAAAALAKRVGQSRSWAQRVLDPKNTSITLKTMVKAAASVGYTVELKLEPRIDAIERVRPPAGAKVLMADLADAVSKLP